ncbi:MAG: hypothetical protein EAZ84_09895 [Verrucomicrobia bacterium]|nr:MAG: hypothetical protein EAZ84_09895 [Verrucomicrobiota bacterium]
MSLRRRVLPAIHNGVSQQPPILRSSDQTEDELNTWAIMAEGIGKRPPTEHLAVLSGVNLTNSFVHHINRDTTERYIVVITQTGIRVFDHLTGAEKTVNAPGGYGYLTGGKFRAVTVADYTFIVNTTKLCQLATAGSDVTYDPDYFRWLNSRPVNTAGDLAYDAVWGGAVGGAPLQYNPNLSAGSYAGELASIEKLPETAANGTMYKIIGSAETGFSSYYVRRNGAVWDETVANGLRNAIDATTMPHALVREPNGTFTFAPFSWANRTVGDEDSNPPPSFIGRNINDVFFYQNRMGFLVDENVVLSCAGDFGNYWRNTVVDYVASDIIDVAVTTSNVAILNYALAFNNGIMAFADQTQFSITNSEEGLTPESIAIRPVTSYQVNTNVRPVTMGTEVYYCGNQSDNSVVWEYTRQDDSDTLASAEVTAHCPKYLPSGLTKMIGATNHKAVFALTGGSTVYVYQYYWDGNEKIVSAWRKWDMGDTVVGAEFIDGYLYLLITRLGTLHLERLSLQPTAKPTEQDNQVYLDRRVKLTGVYNSGTNRTTYTFPYVPNQSRVRLVRSKTHPTAPGSLVNPATYQWTSAQVLTVLGQEPVDVTVGESYTMRFQFSRQFPLDYQGRPVSTGRLQLRTFTIYYSNTGFFRTEVKPYGSAAPANVEEVVPAKMSNFTGKVVGANDLTLNKPSFQTGSYSFQVYGDAAQCEIAVSNDTHVASTLVSAEWEGFYYSRAN